MEEQDALDGRSLAALAERLSPGATVENIEALPGGLDARMCSFALIGPSGRMRSLVLRRYTKTTLARELGIAERAWRTLSVLEQLAVPAPRPLWFDAAGALFGTPAIVMTKVPGRTVLDPPQLAPWTEQLARALAALHATPTDTVDLRFLPGPGASAAEVLADGEGLAARIAGHSNGPAIVDALRLAIPRVHAATPVLIHGDYWPGNTVWDEGRVSAIVDWDSAAIDSPGLDVGYCRLDLAMLAGGEAPDLFLRAYEAAAGRPVSQLAFWDLLAALRALPDPARWLPGYHGLGRREITADQMRERLRGFIHAALTRFDHEVGQQNGAGFQSGHKQQTEAGE